MSDQPDKRPSLRITGLHIERLKAIESLRLPEDGLGWGGTIPPVVLVGGPNGSGKTTLFEFLVHAVSTLQRGLVKSPWTDIRAWVDIELSVDGECLETRYIEGPSAFFGTASRANVHGWRADMRVAHGNYEKLYTRISKDLGAVPGVVFLPSDGRDLKMPAESYKAPGKLDPSAEFVYRWTPPEKWKQSLEALLYGLRWEELNAQAEGRAVEGAFSAYAEEYRALTGGANKLVWHNATLMVDVDGKFHSLEELSSGEKQVLLILAELRRHWRPGSLVLIDEPELHLHDALQARLYDRLLALQRERGGQVWLATQSGYLFENAEPNTRVILKRKSGS